MKIILHIESLIIDITTIFLLLCFLNSKFSKISLILNELIYDLCTAERQLSVLQNR